MALDCINGNIWYEYKMLISAAKSGSRWLLYGYGVAAQRILNAAVKHPDFRASDVVVSGRDPVKTAAFADRFGVESRPFDLNDAHQHISDVRLVLHCAGPFVHTSKPMLNACLAHGVHYLDITGELGVFRDCHLRHAEAVTANIVVLPGVGTDVVPTDCLVRALSAQMPNAVELSLALLKSGSARSGGTMKTAVEGIAAGNVIMEDGAMRTVPMGHRRLRIKHEGTSYSVASMPLGDVYSAFWSTGIPNVTVFGPAPAAAVCAGRFIRPFLRTTAGLRFAKRAVDRFVSAPELPADSQTPLDEDRNQSLFWAEVKDDKGRKMVATYSGIPGSAITANAASSAVFEVLKGKLPAGATTAGAAFGSAFAERWGKITFLSAA